MRNMILGSTSIALRAAGHRPTHMRLRFRSRSHDRRDRLMPVHASRFSSIAHQRCACDA